MAVNTQFAIAVHIMAGLGYNSGDAVNSCDLAYSINTSPSFVRRVLAKLSKANLIETSTGKGGCCILAKPTKEISLLDIYHAVDAPKAFAIHQYKVQKPCPVSCHIKESLQKVLDKAQKSMEECLGEISLAEFISDLKRK